MNSDTEDESPIKFKRSQEMNEVVITYDDRYKITPLSRTIGLVDTWFRDTISFPWYLVIFITLLSGVSAVISVLPYTVYESFLPSLQLKSLCISRSIAFGIIFYNAWIEMHVALYTYLFVHDIGIQKPINIFRTITCCLFVVIYSGLYAWKWYIEEIPIKYAAITLSFISLGWVFYRLIYDQMNNIFSSSIVQRKRKILLDCISKFKALAQCDADILATTLNRMSDSNMSPFSIFFAIRDDVEFYKTDYETLMLEYEKDFDDTREYVRLCITNILLGCIWIALWLTMIEDYGYAIFKITHLEDEGYLWLSTAICGITSALYILCSYNLMHNFTKKLLNLLTLHDSMGVLKSFGWKLPFVCCGALIASVRLNSSYSVFGRIAGKFALPYSLGFTLIWSGVILVFMLDLITSTEMLCRALKNLIILIGSSNNVPVCCKYLQHAKDYLTVCYYTERAKYIILNVNDDELSSISRNILCRVF